MKILNLVFVILFLVSCSTPIKSYKSDTRPKAKNTNNATKKHTRISTSPVSSGDVSALAATGGSPASATGVVNTAHNVNSLTAKVEGYDPEKEEAKFLQLIKSDYFFDALKISSELSVKHPVKNKSDFYRSESIDIINSKLKSSELNQVIQSSDFGYLRGYALFREAQNVMVQSPEESKKYFNSVIEFSPESDLAFRSQKILSDMEAIKRVSPQTVGVVLPLSGKSSAIGQRILRGIQLGLGTHQSFSKFKIAIIDSEGRSDTARKGVEKLIKEDNVIAIIGGVLSKTVSSELSIASDYNIPFIYLSSKQGVGEIHPFSIRNALTSEIQMRQLVRTAIKDLNLHNFAILYPNDPYGVEYANSFWDEVLAQGGKIVAAQYFESKITDFRPMIQRLVGTFYIEARKDEFNQKLKLLRQSSKSKSSRENINYDDLLPPIQNFDALFVPDQAKVVSQVGAFLNYSGVKETVILGTNLLNTSGTAKKLMNLNFPVYFVDSFISDGPQEIQTDFSKDYYSLFNEKPSQIEIAAYDAGLILRQFILSGTNNREDLGRQLVQLKKFPGSYGELSLTSKKDILRPLFSLTYKNGEIKEISKNAN